METAGWQIAGWIVVAVTMFEIIATTMREGGGPISRRVLRLTWRATARLRRALHPQARALAGPFILAGTVAWWMAFLWVGFYLLNAGPHDAIVDASTRQPAGQLERIYFTGFNLATLGVGDYIPMTTTGRIIAVLTALGGFFAISFSVTYMLSVITALGRRKAFASRVRVLASDPQGLAIRALQHPEAASDALSELASALTQLDQDQLTYPMVQYFHSTDARHSPAGALALLDEGLTLLRYGVQELDDPLAFASGSCRRAMTRYLETLEGAFLSPTDTPPDEPDRARLSAAASLGSEAEWQRAVADLRRRRSLLRAAVEDDCWQWRHVVGDQPDADAPARERMQPDSQPPVRS